MNKLIDELIDLALKEDIGDGDHTSLACIPEDSTGTAELLAKDQGIIAGISVAEAIFERLDPDVIFKSFMNEGDFITPGDVVFHVEGSVRALLQAERVVLNIMQRMSGVATQTKLYVSRLKGLHTKILDTRKTTPGMRLLDKQAVKLGGGTNHRIGLYDMIMIKDNHVDFAGGIEKAIEKTKNYLQEAGKNLKIEVEARTLEDVKKILSIGGVERIMLDNFSIEDTKTAVELIGDQCQTESSGGITIENLRDYAKCGVDFISVGALTHQIKSLDLSLKAIDY